MEVQKMHEYFLGAHNGRNGEKVHTHTKVENILEK